MKVPKLETINTKLIDHMNEAVWVGDENERTVYANPKFCDLLGYKLKDIIGEESYIFWDEESAEKVRSVNTTKRKKGISSSYEGSLLTKKGKKVPVLLSGTPLPDGGTIGIITDLTELKKKETQAEIMSKAISFATDAIITFDKKGKILSWNNGAKIVFGHKEEKIVGKKLKKIFNADEVDSILNHLEVLHNFELNGIHQNKSQVLVSATLTPIFRNDGRLNFYMLIARDITSQSKFEEEISLKYKKMKEAYNKFGTIRRQMDYVFDLLEMCKEYHDKQTVFDFIVSSIIMLARVDACVLRIYNKDKNSLEMVSSFGVANDWHGKSSIKYRNSLTEKAVIAGNPLKIIDITKEPKYQSKYLAKKNNLYSLLLIPLRFKSEPVGSLSLYAAPEKKLEIFENDFIEKYASLVEVVVAMMTS